MMRILWTSEEKDVLEKMVNEGFSLAAIRKVLKSRTEDSIRGQARTMGIDITGKPEIDYEAFKSMLKGAKQKCV
jgi:diphthamide synthase (EF-2-diphthine--ammonia ligase)